MNKKLSNIFYWFSTVSLILLIVLSGFFIYWSYKGKILHFDSFFFEFKETIKVKTPQEINVDLSYQLKNDLKKLWGETEEKEYAICIDGWFTLEGENMTEKYDEQIIFLEQYTDLTIGTTNYVGVPQCETMAVLHKHPSTGCNNILNIADAEGAKRAYERGVSLFLIQCEENMLEVYTRHNLYKGQVIRFE